VCKPTSGILCIIYMYSFALVATSCGYHAYSNLAARRRTLSYTLYAYYSATTRRFPRPTIIFSLVGVLLVWACYIKARLFLHKNCLGLHRNEYRQRARHCGHGPLPVRGLCAFRPHDHVFERIAGHLRLHRRWFEIQVTTLKKNTVN